MRHGAGQMLPNSDYRDLFAELNAASARYLLVGAHALAFHGRPRFTKDLDVWVEATAENAPRVAAALLSFGAPAEMVRREDFETPGLIVQLGVEPNRIDITTVLDGLTFEEAWPGRVMTEYGDQRVPVIGLDDFARNKRSTGRLRDLADLEDLGIES
jgi:hypothetical protein